VRARGRWLGRVIDFTLAEVDLSGSGERVITTLSGGGQQRAHLARVLVQLAYGERTHGPGLLLLDEPIASLDLNHQLRLLSVTARHAERGVAVLAILHDLNLAAVFADRVVVMHRGRSPPPDDRAR
jgi:iron complex transport system ATP-binding protein